MFWKSNGSNSSADEIVLVFDGAVTPELGAVVAEFETKLPLNLVKLPKKFRV